MPSAHVKVLPRPPYHGDRMLSALQGLGYKARTAPQDAPERGDVLVLWNRYPRDERLARAYESAGGAVIVVENGYFGRNFRGSEWFAAAKTQHNGAGECPEGDPDRWASLEVKVEPWKTGGEEIVILASRGMGSMLCAEPPGWVSKTERDLRRRTDRPVRIRRHPGPQAQCLADDLQADLANAHAAVTWASGAGLKAMAMGIPVFNASPYWIGRDAARPIRHDLEDPFLGDRGPMFHRVATAMYSLGEIESGEAFRCLL